MEKQTAAGVQDGEKRKLDPNREKASKERQNLRNARRPKISERNTKQQQMHGIKERNCDKARGERRSSVNSNVPLTLLSEILPLSSSNKRSSETEALVRKNLNLKKMLEDLERKEMLEKKQKD